MRLTTWPDRDALMIGLAGRIGSQMRQALTLRDRASLALPGGTTPGPLLDILSGSRLDWARVDVLPGDERLVPLDDPRSNAGQIARRLLHGPAAAARLITLADPEAPDAGLAAARAALAGCLPLAVCVLGMGADGHVASLFPGAAGLAGALAADAAPLAALPGPQQGERRLSLTAPALLGAGRLHLLITGAQKRRTLERAARPGPVEDMPVRLILDAAEVHYAE